MQTLPQVAELNDCLSKAIVQYSCLKNAQKDTLLKFTSITKGIFALLLVSGAGTLFASEVDELRERAKAMRTKAVFLAEQGNEDQTQRIQVEAAKLLEKAEQLEKNSSGRREKEFALSIDKEAFKLKDRLQDLLTKERIMRNQHAADSELAKVRGEIANIERALHKIQTQHDERSGHRPEFRVQIEKLERVGQRMHHLRVAAENLKLAEEHDLAHKLMTKAEDIERDVHAAKKRLAAEMHEDSERHDADKPDIVAKLKEENERLRAELRELKQNLDKGR